MPLPPYLGRDSDKEDDTRYQTVFARTPGAVAAPTAGLHFTQEILDEIPHAFVTLHVGTGTFRPVHCEDIREHRMHPEQFSISAEAAQDRQGTARCRRRDDERARARSCAPRKWKTGRANGIDRHFHLSALSISTCRSFVHEFSSAALDSAHAGERVRRPRISCSALTRKRSANVTASTATAIAC